MIIFGTEKLKLITKPELIALFDNLAREGYNFDPLKMVWHDKNFPNTDAFHYIGLCCNEWGGTVIHVPVKIWNTYETDVSREAIHTHKILTREKEFCGQMFKRKGGFDGKITEIPKIEWEKV